MQDLDAYDLSEKFEDLVEGKMVHHGSCLGNSLALELICVMTVFTLLLVAPCDTVSYYTYYNEYVL